MHSSNQSTSSDLLCIDQIKRIISLHLPTYQNNQIQIKSLSGLTNEIFKITCQEKPSLIFRKFGGQLNRDIDNQIFKTLEQSGIAPKCYYACSNYRIEEFIQNSTHPSIQELKSDDIKIKILNGLVKYHSVQIEMLKNKPLLIVEIFSDKYFSKIKHQKNKSQNQNFHQLYLLLEKEYLNIEALKSELIYENPQNSKNKIKFCHNDLNNRNIFLKPQILLIDYEYSSYNYFYYDIANFLNQCNINYQIDKFPYFQIESKMTLQQIQHYAQLCPEKYSAIDRDILKGLVACNLFWAVWSIIMAYDPSQGHFGTVEHGLARMELFYYYKNLLKVSAFTDTK